LCAADDKFSDRTYQRAVKDLSIAKIIGVMGDILWKNDIDQRVTATSDTATWGDTE